MTEVSPNKPHTNIDKDPVKIQRVVRVEARSNREIVHLLPWNRRLTTGKLYRFYIRGIPACHIK